MTDLIFWMGIILCVGVFGWMTFADMMRRADEEKKPLSLLTAVKIFLVTCGVICLSIGKNSFVPENLDASGDDSKVTVTDKEVKDLETRRRKKVVQDEKYEQKRTKENDKILLDDMKDFKKRVMER